MRRLRERFNETINLAVVHDGEVVYVDLLESSRPFRMAAMIGSRMALQSTSLAKAIIAYSPENELTAFLNQLPPAESRKLNRRKRRYNTCRVGHFACPQRFSHATGRSCASYAPRSPQLSPRLCCRRRRHPPRAPSRSRRRNLCPSAAGAARRFLAHRVLARHSSR